MKKRRWTTSRFREVVHSWAAVIVLALCGSSLAASAEDYHPTRLIVKFNTQQSAIALTALTSKLQAVTASQLHASSPRRKAADVVSSTYVVTFADSLQRAEAEDQLARDPAVRYVERDYLLELFHDPLYHYQWSLENSGQEYPGIIRVAGSNNDTLKMLSGVVGADINRHEVEELPTDRDRVVVAIIDTGVDYFHPDLADNVWKNPLEAEGLPGEDDDLNGYADDIVGYDFSGDALSVLTIVPDPIPEDIVGHGTHVAGIVGAVTGNNIGIEGVAPNVSIMCIKIFPNAFTSVSSQAIIYAVDQGAKVINASWGSPYFSNVLNDAIQYALDNGVLFVAASGNSGDSSPFYPATIPGVFTVGACNSSDRATTFSTFGEWVDLSAPGQDILSLRADTTDLYAPAGEPGLRIIDDHYLLADGTSMASPHVAGAAAFILSYAPGLSSDSVRNLLIATADQIASPTGNSQGEYSVYTGYGRINLERATSVLSGSYAEIKSPLANSINGGTIPILGSAFSESGGDFVLEALPASEGAWIEVASGNANLITEQLAQWDTSPYDGDTHLRLSVGNGIAYTTSIRLVNNVVLDIASPRDGDTVSASVDIKGTASAPEFDSFDLHYIPDTGSQQPVLIKHGTVPAFAELLTTWSLGPVRSGTGTLVLTLNAGIETYQKSVPIVLKTLLNEDYPVRADTRPHHTSQPADLNGDGHIELITGGREGIVVLEYLTRNTRVLDPGIGSSYQSSPAVYDFNNDGSDELVVISDSGITVMDGEGENLPGWPRMLQTGVQFLSYPTPLISDIDGDGNPEVIFVSNGGNFYCFRSDGSGYFHSRDGFFAALNSTGVPRQFGQPLPAYVFAHDFDEDGFRDIGSVYGLSGGDGGVFLFSGKNGLPLYPKIGSRVKYTAAPFGGVLADFDADGVPEIGFAHFEGDQGVVVRIIEADGEDLPGWPRRYPEKFQYLSPYPAAGDLDGDSIPELVIVFSAPLDGGELYIWRADGRPWLDSELGRRDGFVAGVSNALANPLILDTDNDGGYEIVARGGATFFGKPERIFSFELDGTETPGWPQYTFAAPSNVLYSPNTPLAGDFDKDGLLELYMGASDLSMYVWELPTVASDSAILWNGFLNDQQNSGVLPFALKSPVPPPEPPLPTSFRLAQNYPNPFNANTAIEFALTNGESATLEIFNTLGQRVKTLVNDLLPAGFYRYEWDATDADGNRVASGVYYYRLRFGAKSETRAMVLLK